MDYEYESERMNDANFDAESNYDFRPPMVDFRKPAGRPKPRRDDHGTEQYPAPQGSMTEPVTPH